MAPEAPDAAPRADAPVPRADAAAGPTRLITTSLAHDPTLDVALGSALLEAAGISAGPLFRIGIPAPTLSFGRLDRILPGFPAAVAAARARGFTPTLRVGGGRAAAIHGGAISFGVAAPAAAESTTAARFAALAALVQGALARVGVIAEHGQLPDEYCPRRLEPARRRDQAGRAVAAGAQRRDLDRGAAAGDRRRPARAVLEDVHAALRLPLDPTTVGAVEDVAPGVTVAAMAAALRDELAARGPLIESPLDAPTLAAAERLRERHALGE